MQTKSLFMTGNMILLLATIPTSAVAAFGANVLEGVRQTPLGAPEIVDGLSITKQALENEKAKIGVDTERYDVLTQIQDTLIAKADQAGITEQFMNQYDQAKLGTIDEGDGGIRFDPALANQERDRNRMNGGSRHSRTGHAS